MRLSESWTIWNVHTVQDKRSETLGKTRSLLRFKNERTTVIKKSFGA
jgi:hypothetical protein